MKKSFNSRRVPRKIGQDDEEDSKDVEGTGSRTNSDQAKEPVVKRPNISSKPKKRSSLRLSFGPGEASSDGGDEDNDTSIFTPKKSNLSRLAIERNAEKKASRTSLSSEHLPVRASAPEEKPTYNKDYIAELRNSTPSTPKDLRSPQTEEEQELSKEIDIASKFGPLASLSTEDTSAIPTEAEIREKKERRARLATEQKVAQTFGDDDDEDWASDDSEFRKNKNEISLRPKEKYGETRLVRDDEDIAEGFDDFVEDGGISLGRKAEREAERKRRAEMAELIADAERDSDDDGSEDSEADRNAAYEAAQTRAGTYGRSGRDADESYKTPPRITPLPDLDQVMERLRAELRSKEQAKERVLKRMDDLKEEKARIDERQQWVQEQLKVTGENYEKLRIDAGLGGGPATPLNGADGGKMVVSRGLESLGATPIAPPQDSSEE